MRHACTLLLLATAWVLGSGFVKSTRIVKVKADGSGAIHVRRFFNLGLPDEALAKRAALDKEKLKEEAALYGSDVTYVAAKEAHGAGKWQGYIVKYRFKDVSKLLMRPASLPHDRVLKGAKDPELMGWRMSMTPAEAGGVATLRISRARVEADEWGDDDDDDDDDGWGDDDDDDDGWGDDDDDDDDGWGDDDDDDDGWGDDDDDEDPWDAEPAAGATLSQQKGRRYVTYVQVQGKITAAGLRPVRIRNLRSREQPNTVLLNDEQWEHMWSVAKARRYMQSADRNLAPLIGKQARIPGFVVMHRRMSISFEAGE